MAERTVDANPAGERGFHGKWEERNWRNVPGYVNGVPLRELTRAVEAPCATADGQPDLAGSYLGLVNVDRLRWLAMHYLGEPRETWFDDGDTTLLGCICGESGCWPLTAIVDVNGMTVTWRHFRNGHRDWDLSALGPFVFGREQYEQALRATAASGG